MSEASKVEEREMSQEFKEEKPKKNKGLKIVSKIINLILTLAVLGWAGMMLYDYFQVSNEKEPKFCLEENVIEHNDGVTKECKGIGYKIYRYDRESFKGLDFGPFWIKERTDIK